jgi:hypothetical protein
MHRYSQTDQYSAAVVVAVAVDRMIQSCSWPAAEKVAEVD